MSLTQTAEYGGDLAVDGDITGVTAGNGLTGGGTTGDIVLNVGAGTGIIVGGTSVSHMAHTSQVTGATDLTIVDDSA